jgi:hypothetical protein
MSQGYPLQKTSLIMVDEVSNTEDHAQNGRDIRHYSMENKLDTVLIKAIDTATTMNSVIDGVRCTRTNRIHAFGLLKNKFGILWLFQNTGSRL